MQDVGLPIAGDQIQAAGHAHILFVKIDGENLILHVVFAALSLSRPKVMGYSTANRVTGYL